MKINLVNVLRTLSLWEPFIEPWRSNISWKHEEKENSNDDDWTFKVDASDK